ncbi:MAG: septum formation initiator family protein [Pelagibacteraceae bacterium]|mgnify:FL=1|jgi:cell division protein DivIC
MKILEILKNKKLFFFQIFLTLYIAINLVGGDRGLVSYFEKKNYEEKLSSKYLQLSKEIEEIEHKNKLLADKIDIDYIDTLYRSKLKFGTKDEVLIKLK